MLELFVSARYTGNDTERLTRDLRHCLRCVGLRRLDRLVVHEGRPGIRRRGECVPWYTVMDEV